MSGSGRSKNTEIHGHILVVDNDARRCSCITELLNESGFCVSQADNGEKAISLINGNNNRFNLVLIDLEMPDMSGFNLVRRLKKDYVDIPYFVVSGFGDKMVIMEMLKNDCKKTVGLMIGDSNHSGRGLWR